MTHYIAADGFDVPIALPSTQLLELSGADAVTFAHAQFANDVRALETGRWQWNLWLSAQGRVRYFFALLRLSDERLLLWLRGGAAATLRAELARFVFRAKVVLREPGEWRVCGADEAETSAAVAASPQGSALAQRDGAVALRLPHGSRWLLLAAASGADAEAATNAARSAQWRLDDIRAGLPHVAPPLQDELLPQWLGLERWPAFSVAKGCYPGQEVIARLHFKGGNKRGLYRVAGSCTTPPPPGTKLLSAAGEPAVLVDAAAAGPQRAEALVVLSDAAATEPLHDGADGATLGDIQVVSRFG